MNGKMLKIKIKLYNELAKCHFSDLFGLLNAARCL